MTTLIEKMDEAFLHGICLAIGARTDGVKWSDEIRREGMKAALAVVHAHYTDPANVSDAMALEAGRARHGSTAGFEAGTIRSYRDAIAAAMKAAKSDV